MGAPPNQDYINYEIDPQRGFLPPTDPLASLPKQFSAWDDLAHDLPKLLVSDQVRSKVEKMPLEKFESLKSKSELERAMAVLSYIGHAYVWGEQKPPKSLPASLAQPWHSVATRLGRPPVLSYASYALHNWRRIDPGGPIALGNIALLLNFLGGVDEEWFVLIHVDIEAKAALALNSIFPLQAQAKAKNPHGVLAELTKIESSLSGMYQTLDRTPERCDPYIYYHRVRPYIHAWKDHPLFPNGLVYQGVPQYNNQPQKFRGETGAQSSIVPALDAALGVMHKDDPLRAYLNEMRDYMPPRHRAFIEAAESNGSIRDFVLSSSDKSMKELYNKCVEWIERFRTLHLEYAARYIFKQTQTSASNPSAVGTGGTPFMPYLKKHRDETAEHKLK